jgi:putative Mg2+ transporter-C (MgtC) family protein
MTTTLPWQEVAIRLTLSVIGGFLVGLNRTEHGRPAGLRTTLLVCLAAAVSMIQCNLLMDTVGKAKDSFVVLDLMRLPLGILTGVGFIGAGAILRKENRVLGVTTAATMWFVTVMGLCFGGGQNGLGLSALVIALFVLWGLKRFEAILPQDCYGSLIVTHDGRDVADGRIREMISQPGFQITSFGIMQDNAAQHREFSCEVRWQEHWDKPREPVFVDELARLPGVVRLKWTPVSAPGGRS